MSIDISYEGSKLVLPEIVCDCGINHAHPDMDIYIGDNILSKVPEYLLARDLGKNVVLVTDNVVYDIAGKKVLSILAKAGYHIDLCLLERDQPLVPNQEALGEIMLTINNDTDFLLAVGSGSITDLTRYTAHIAKKPFAVVGTAPSMDGYTSVVAPLTYDNLKVNKPAGYPRVLICDLDIFRKAPYPMLLSGFGDVIGKYIAKADWILGNIVTDEPICPVCVELITLAVKRCMDNVEGIKQRSIKGVRSLIEGLILAGITILIIGHTRPVASNEHSIAHYWEMMKLLAHEQHPSHGISVGAATIYALTFFEYYLNLDMRQIGINRAKKHNITKEARDKLILEKYGNTIGKAIIRDNGDDYLKPQEHEHRFYALVDNHELIRRKLACLPSADQMKKVYADLGLAWKAKDIGIEDELLLNSLLYAKEYRSRYTVFKSAQELGVLPELAQQVFLDLK